MPNLFRYLTGQFYCILREILNQVQDDSYLLLYNQYFFYHLNFGYFKRFDFNLIPNFFDNVRIILQPFLQVFRRFKLHNHR